MIPAGGGKKEPFFKYARDDVLNKACPQEKLGSWGLTPWGIVRV